jgi:uncharacterized protein YbjT (DUF2867 family)
VEVVIVGGHGQIALRLERLLADRGDRARGVIRKPEQAADVEAAGAEAVVCDVEAEDLTDAVRGADAVVFAAGAGPGSGPERKRTVDYGGAVKLIEAAKANGVDRYLMVSAIGADRPERWSEQMRPYYEAKAEADGAVRESGLAYTIVRPGSLTDDPGSGRVSIAERIEGGGAVPRDDVAAVLAEALGADNTIGRSFDLLEGETPVADAVAAL